MVIFHSYVKLPEGSWDGQLGWWPGPQDITGWHQAWPANPLQGGAPTSYKWVIICLTLFNYRYNPKKNHSEIGLLCTNLAIPNWGTSLYLVIGLLNQLSSLWSATLYNYTGWSPGKSSRWVLLISSGANWTAAWQLATGWGVLPRQQDFMVIQWWFNGKYNQH